MSTVTKESTERDVKTHHLFFRTTPGFRLRVDRAARHKGIKMAEYIRAAVIEKLERDEKVMGTGAGVAANGDNVDVRIGPSRGRR